MRIEHDYFDCHNCVCHGRGCTPTNPEDARECKEFLHFETVNTFNLIWGPE